jgi:hypothetical protein
VEQDTSGGARHGTNDIGKATNGSSGEAGKTKMVKLETTSAQHEKCRQPTQSRRGKRATAVELAVQAAAGVAAAMAVRAVQDGARGLAEAGRRGF